MYLCLISAGMGICALHDCMGHQREKEKEKNRASDFIVRISTETTFYVVAIRLVYFGREGKVCK